EAAQHDPEKAIHLISVFTWSTLAPPPSALGPGTWIWGASKALNRRVLRSNPEVNVFHRGFVAGDRYSNGLQAVAQLSWRLLFILGTSDPMTQARAAQPLIEAATSAGRSVKVVQVEAGHHEMTEAPEAVLGALMEFLRP
ncbi:MAG TPA: alpha/beta hydrolase, partial [Ramlibacter sp.]